MKSWSRILFLIFRPYSSALWSFALAVRSQKASGSLDRADLSSPPVVNKYSFLGFNVLSFRHRRGLNKCDSEIYLYIQGSLRDRTTQQGDAARQLFPCIWIRCWSRNVTRKYPGTNLQPTRPDLCWGERAFAQLVGEIYKYMDRCCLGSALDFSWINGLLNKMYWHLGL